MNLLIILLIAKSTIDAVAGVEISATGITNLDEPDATNTPTSFEEGVTGNDYTVTNTPEYEGYTGSTDPTNFEDVTNSDPPSLTNIVDSESNTERGLESTSHSDEVDATKTPTYNTETDLDSTSVTSTTIDDGETDIITALNNFATGESALKNDDKLESESSNTGRAIGIFIGCLLCAGLLIYGTWKFASFYLSKTYDVAKETSMVEMGTKRASYIAD